MCESISCVIDSGASACGDHTPECERNGARSDDQGRQPDNPCAPAAGPRIIAISISGPLMFICVLQHGSRLCFAY